MDRMGFEPMTVRLRGVCSTSWATSPNEEQTERLRSKFDSERGLAATNNPVGCEVAEVRLWNLRRSNEPTK